jgi:predicted helicase
MATINLSPDDSSIQRYYEQLQEYDDVDAMHEGTVRSAFQRVLQDVGRQRGWTLVEEHTMRERGIRVDGAVKNEFDLYHGYWEAKDSDDDLEREVQKKLQKGYPTKNTVFQAPNQAVLVQDGGIVFEGDIDDPRRLVDLLKAFFEYSEPAHEDWERAVDRFKERVPELGQALKETIEREREENRRFRDAFQQFFDTCKQAINPNLAEESVEEMLIQHLLTERIFRTVFDNPDFVRRNVIAKEIENVIDALASRSFSRRDFLNQLDPFYNAIEEAAGAAEDFSEKQKFLNSIYEQFFQGFAVDVADTHGIVYTPQPIVDFMVESVSELLEGEFDVELGDEDVHVLDPFVGTGNFIMRVMKEISGRNLPTKYGAEGDPELHANEVMLLPYYVASMNIEHEYYNRIGEYEPFEGICLVDTFGAEDQRQRPQLFTEENTERVKRQQAESIKVIIGNPPYNAWQVNANDNNQNRTYEHVDDRVRETYAKDSSATLKNALYDPYVKAIRWATDRIGEEGVVAFVTNNSFVDNLAFDGMRKHLAADFDAVYVLDCGGNVRKNPKLSGTTHNVFGIQVGVSINFFVKRRGDDEDTCDIRYYRMGEFLRKEERYEVLDDAESVQDVDWETLEPDEKNRWLVEATTREFESYLPVGTKEDKRADRGDAESIFKTFSNGVKSNRDAWVYDFRKAEVAGRMQNMIDIYNQEVDRWERRTDREVKVREFILNDDTTIKWDGSLRRQLKNGKRAEFDEAKLRLAHYRPYVTKWLFFDKVMNNRDYLFPYIFPDHQAESENRAIALSAAADNKPFQSLAVDQIADLHLTGDSQCFPFYVYDEDGTNRWENVTDWALGQFRSHYGDDFISKWDIFHYVYAVLHHPRYRERYEGNLKRQLPRIPFAPAASFQDFVDAGEHLKELHVGYEDAEPYDLNEEETSKQVEWRAEKMKFEDDAQTVLRYNDFLTLRGIPERAHDYRLGNRSALEWLVDQYRVRTYNRYDITHDPNDPDDKWYIVDLVKRITTVSVETVDIVEDLPALGLPND